jgi:hypothetical protein
MTMAQPKPLILDNAELKIGAVSLACSLNHIELNPDVSTVTLTTMCGEVDYPGVIKWALVATFYQSFDAGSVEETLSDAVDGGVPVAFVLTAYRDVAVSATNPSWTGEVIPQPYSPISGDAGGESTVEIEWSLVGPPVKSIVPGA